MFDNILTFAILLKSNSDSIDCYGFCGHKYHFTCVSKNNSSYKKAIIPYLVNIPNLQWYCNDCLSLTFNGTFNGILSKLNKCTDNLNDVLTPKVTQNADVPNSLTNQNDSSVPINAQLTSDNIDITAPLTQQASISSVNTQLNVSSISMADADADTDTDQKSFGRNCMQKIGLRKCKQKDQKKSHIRLIQTVRSRILF